MTGAEKYIRNPDLPEFKIAEPNYSIAFHRDGKTIGKFNFNRVPATFTGEAEPSAQIFVNWVLKSFDQHVDDLVAKAVAEEREACAEISEECVAPWEITLAIRARSSNKEGK